MISRRLGIATLLLLLLCGTSSQAQPSDETILSRLLREAAREALGQIPGRTLTIAVIPGDAHPMASQVTAEEAAVAGIRLVESNAAEVRLSIDLREMKQYTVSLSNSSYLRRCVLHAGLHLIRQEDGLTLWSKTVNTTASDTLDTTPSVWTRDYRTSGSDSWLNSLLIPVLAAAAAIITVVLLFTVRGS